LLFHRARDLRNHLPADAAYVGQRGEHPHRRRTKRHDAQRFNGVPGSPSDDEIVRFRIGRVHTFDAADIGDEDLQCGVDECAIDLRPSQARRESHFAGFAHEASAQAKRRSDDTLWEREEVVLLRHGR
jgi:hypothetical protein